MFNFSNSYFTNAQAYTDPDPANVGGITATNTSTTYFGSADPRYAENHGQDGVYLEVGEAIRIDINDNGSMTDDSWLRITTIARYQTTVLLSNGTTVPGAVNIVTAVNPSTGVSYQTMLFGDNMVASINAATAGGGIGITSITLNTYTGYGPSGGADLTQVMLGTNFDSEVFSGLVDFVCFAGGTLIETADGAVEVERLAVGDLVETKDHGLQPVRWIGSRRLSAADLLAQGKLMPIRIHAGALGGGHPVSDLVVSPQHRMLLRSPIVRKMFHADEILVAAKHLVGIEGIEVATEMAEVTYFHILLDRHEIIVANGAEAESLLPAKQAMGSMSAEQMEEILTIFPALAAKGYAPAPARMLASGRMARHLAERHRKNEKPVVSDSFRPMLMAS